MIEIPTCIRCLILNEIGEIAQDDDEEEAKKARDFLFSLLKVKNPSDRFYAFAYLSGLTGLDQKTLDEIGEFEINPENRDIVSAVKEQRESQGS